MPEAAPQPPVLVTGAAGFIGSLLAQRLLENGRQVIGLDIRKPAERPPNLTFHEMDLSRPLNPELLAARPIKTVVHLAFQMREGRSGGEAEKIRLANLECLHNVMEASVTAGANEFIYLSSHTVYGARRENPVPITEDYKSKPLVGFQYSMTKALSEQALWDFHRQHPELNITILRCCMVMGPGEGYVARALNKPLLLMVSGYNPPIQFIHGQDLARLLAWFCDNPVPGVFNVAGNGALPYSDVARILGKKAVTLPSFLAYPLVQAAWRLGLQKEASRGGLDLVRYPIVLSTDKLLKNTGFQCQYASEGALRAYVESRSR